MERINAVFSQQYKSEELPRAATYRPTPHCEELTPSAGPECTSNRGPKIIGVGADFSLNCSTSNILTQDFIAMSRKGITPDSLLTGMGESVCVRTAVSQKACCQCMELKMPTCKFYWHFKWWRNSEVMNSFFDILMFRLNKKKLTPPFYSSNVWVSLCVHYSEMYNSAIRIETEKERKSQYQVWTGMLITWHPDTDWVTRQTWHVTTYIYRQHTVHI